MNSKHRMTAIIGYADTLRTLELTPESRRRGHIFSEAKRVEALSGKLFGPAGPGPASPQPWPPCRWTECCGGCPPRWRPCWAL